jgi:hypothetical protein
LLKITFVVYGLGFVFMKSNFGLYNDRHIPEVLISVSGLTSKDAPYKTKVKTRLWEFIRDL